METTQFVLGCSVFLILASFMVSLPGPESEPPERTRFASYLCKFDSFCKGTPCEKFAASDIRLIPEGEEGMPSLFRVDRPKHLTQLVRGNEALGLNYRSAHPGEAHLRIYLNETGAMRYEEFDEAALLTATGQGYCSGPDVMNEDKV